MPKGKVRIGQGRVVPFAGRLLITALLLAFMAYMIDQSEEPTIGFMIIFIICSSAVHAAWTTRKILEVHQSNPPLICHYFWVLGFKVNKKALDGTPEGLKIIDQRKNANRKKYEDFQLFLQLRDHQDLFMISREEPEALDKVARDIGKKLSIPIEDSSTKNSDG